MMGFCNQRSFRTRQSKVTLLFLCLAATFLFVIPSVASAGLICQYSLEGSTQDLIGNYPASNYGATFIAGHSGQAAYFNGSSYIASSLPADVLKDNLTVSCWFKADNTSNQQSLVDQGRDYYGSGWRIYINANKLCFSLNTDAGDNTNEVNISYAFTDTSSFHHVAVTYSSSGANLYLDGKLTASGSYKGSIVYKYNEKLTLGAMAFSVPSFFKYKGALDEVKIWNYALSAGEINQDYTVWAVPAKPVLNAVTTLTNISTQVLSGTKETNTAIYINNSLCAPLDSKTTWSYNYKLSEGDNNLSVISRNGGGLNSDSVLAKITLDTVAPQIVITSPQNNAVVNTKTLTVNYTSDSIAKTKEVTLVEGSNTVTVSDTDLAGNTGSAYIKIILDTEGPSLTIISPTEGEVIQ